MQKLAQPGHSQQWLERSALLQQHRATERAMLAEADELTGEAKLFAMMEVHAHAACSRTSSKRTRANCIRLEVTDPTRLPAVMP